MAENVISGTYQTKRNGGLMYIYVASWEETRQGASWSATVHRNHAVAGAPNGKISKSPGIDYAACVRALVTTGIEARIGIV